MPTAVEIHALLLPLLVAAAAGYVLGSLPFGYLVARSRGVDIFQVGSKSPGATNVRRTLGQGPGNLVFILDALKGGAAAGLPLLLALAQGRGGEHDGGGQAQAAFGLGGLLGFVGLAFALAGHAYSCFTGFRGGKGVATAAGGLAVLMPCVLAVAMLVWVVVFYASRFVSLASILAALSLPASAALMHGGPVQVAVTALVALFVAVRHRANIARLLNGTENRFERRKPPAGGERP